MYALLNSDWHVQGRQSWSGQRQTKYCQTATMHSAGSWTAACITTSIELCVVCVVPVLNMLCIVCLNSLLLVGVIRVFLVNKHSVCYHNPHASYVQLLGNTTLAITPDTFTVVSHDQFKQRTELTTLSLIILELFGSCGIRVCQLTLVH